MRVLTKLLVLTALVAVPVMTALVPTRPDMLYGKGNVICGFCFLSSANVWGPYAFLNYGSVWYACYQASHADGVSPQRRQGL